MRLNKIIFPIATVLLFTSCYDEKMEWGTPDGQGDVSISEIPLDLAEKIANYDYIKNYAAEYMPNSIIGAGLSADFYIDDEEYRQVANDNFQMLTTGNAMKHDAIVQSNGSLDFNTVDAFLQAVPADMKVYGHNFIWHTQQKQDYLRSLIAPEMIVNSDSDIASILVNGDFETGDKTNWDSWGNNSTTTVKAGIGEDGSYAIELYNPSDASEHSAQLAYSLNEPLTNGETYVIRFKAKSDNPAGVLQFAVQNDPNYEEGEGYHTFDVGTNWITCEYEYTCTKDGMNRILINFGKAAGTYTVDNVEFGTKVADPDAGRINLLVNGNFSAGTDSWAKWNGADNCLTWNDTEGNNNTGCMQVINESNNEGGEWKVQIHTNLAEAVPTGTSLYISYYIKVASGEGSVRVSTSTSDGTGVNYQGNQTVAPGWQRIEWELTTTGDVTGINFDLGLMAGTYLIDDVVVSLDPFAAVSTKAANTRASSITYVLKTPEEKREALLGAMEEWIKGMFEHIAGETRFYGWDVINEPIGDDGTSWRGIDGQGFASGDSAPTESEDSGLILNWEDGHFYWGYYLGKEYAVKAFEYARQYAPAGIKLFVNDYNLEYSPTKLASLISLVEYIESQGQTVDGIGTQMHISSDISREQIDAMFQTMAATGKLIRVTELDVKVGTTSPTADQLEEQANAYQMVFESFKANVPEQQQDGITIWSLTDNAREHEYWIPDDAPNIFDAAYGRKHAYKGVCDGIAGYDISSDFTGDMWESAYNEEKEEESTDNE